MFNNRLGLAGFRSGSGASLVDHVGGVQARRVLGNFGLSDSGLRPVQEMNWHCWTHVSIMMDSEQGRVSGLRGWYAVFHRRWSQDPEAGQKTFRAAADQRSANSQTLKIAEISGPLTSSARSATFTTSISGRQNTSNMELTRLRSRRGTSPEAVCK